MIKLILMLFLSGTILALPFQVEAVDFTFGITIVKQTISGNGLFYFNLGGPFFAEVALEVEMIPKLHAQAVSEIGIQTVNKQGSQTITGLGAFGFYVLREQEHDGWTLTDVNCSSTNTNQSFGYYEMGVSFIPVAGSHITCIFTNSSGEAAERNPVVIVPGVLGTEMFKDSERLWLDIARNLLGSDEFMDPLLFDNELLPVDDSVVKDDILRSKFVNIGGQQVDIFDYSQGLINEFTSQGYTEDTSLFVFPYDWRYGVGGIDSTGKTNVDYLKEKIDSVISQTGAVKVDVVAHSTGGLLLKDYLRRNPHSHHVDKAVFVGTPHLGAPKATKVLLTGDNFGVYGLNDAQMQKISQNLPVVYELAPSQEYFNQAGPWVTIHDRLTNTTNHLNFHQTGALLLDERNLNRTAFDNARALHEQSIESNPNNPPSSEPPSIQPALDNFDPSTVGVNSYSIIGCKSETISHITEKRGLGPGNNPTLTYDIDTSQDGDGTVPRVSSEHMNIPTENTYYRIKSNHGKFLSEEDTRQQIVKIITNDPNIEVGDRITQDQTKCQKSKHWLFKIFSPIDVTVTDQDGKQLKRLPDNSIFNDIPGAELVIINDQKFIALPGSDSEVYDIKLQGTGLGTADISIDELNNGQLQKRHWYFELPVTTALSGNLQLNNPASNTPSLTLDTNGDTVADQTKFPDTTLTPEEALDTTPPEANISFNPDTKDILITGTDNVSPANDITIVDEGTAVALTDKTGNQTVLTFKEKDRKRALRAELISLTYNGIPQDLNQNKFVFMWTLDKYQNLKKLEQMVKSKKEYNIGAIFKAETNQTKLTGKDQNGKVNQTLPGLHLLQVRTKEGELEWRVN